MPDDFVPLTPDELRSRFGALYDGHRLWGYLHVRDDEISKPRPLRRERFECLVEEFFRVLPPAPDAVDAADMLGWSDSYVMANEIPDEIARFARNGSRLRFSCGTRRRSSTLRSRTGFWTWPPQTRARLPQTKAEAAACD